MALMCYEAQEEHDPEHADGIAEVLGNLQKQLNVSSCFCFFFPSKTFQTRFNNIFNIDNISIS